ncbi:Protein of unknown function DUF544 [Phytophthora cactorum]|nr:Protein of unknown function DUF544 [Phytophthora cactorum]
MDEAYAVKQTQFLGKPVRYVCQNANGPCPLLAIANVLLLRGQLSLEGIVEPPGFVSAQDLMQLVHPACWTRTHRNGSELQRLTQEKTIKDVAELLPSLLVGLDVNQEQKEKNALTGSLRLFGAASITDFEYTVACAAFDMLDIVLVHGWLLDDQDDKTMKVVGNKSYNELIERLVDYRGVLMTEEANETAASETESLSSTVQGQDGDEEEVKPAAASLQSPLATQTTGFHNLSIEVNCTPASPNAAVSPSSTSSTNSPKKSPSQQTVQTMMKERHMSDADALDAATTLLEEGPVLDEFFNSTASQLTYYGLVKLHEGLRERQLCVFFRNNHFSTLFKFEGALYLLVTDAGYLDEPTVVWELLNEIDGDTTYLDAQFRPMVSGSGGDTTRAAEHTLPNGGLSGEEDEGNLDPDYLLALKFQREEEEIARGSKHVSPRIGVDRDVKDDRSQETSENEAIPVTADGQMMISEEELEAQRQAERYYQEQKRQVDAQTRQYQQEQERLQQQQPIRGQKRRISEGSDCTIS